MKCAVITNPGTFEILQSDSPGIQNSDDVLLAIKAVGVCGSDIHYYQHGRIGDQQISFPFRPGHECAAEVVKTNHKDSIFKPGDRVAIDPLISCGYCEQCTSGREHTCLNQKFLGAPDQAPGALAEFIVLPEKCCFKIPDHMDWATAVLAEPVSIGIYTVDFLKPHKNKSIAILGAGPIGLSVLVSALSEGYERVYVSEKLDYRIETAIRLGAKSGVNILNTDPVAVLKSYEKGGLDYVIECCGEPDAILQSIDLLKPGGKLIITGIPSENEIYFNPHDLRRKEISIHSVRRQNAAVRRAIDMVAKSNFPINEFITHKYKLADTANAFNLVSSYQDNVIKAIIYI